MSTWIALILVSPIAVGTYTLAPSGDGAIWTIHPSPADTTPITISLTFSSQEACFAAGDLLRKAYEVQKNVACLETNQ